MNISEVAGNELEPLYSNSPIIKAFPALKEKFVVDFANGIDVVNDLTRVQNERQSLFNRMFDGFTGTSRRRQDQINTNLKNGVEASLNWLVELTDELAESNYAIARVNDRVNELKYDVAKIATFSSSLRDELESVSAHLNQRLDNMQYQIDQIRSRQNAEFQLDFVFDKLRTSSDWSPLSLSQQIYAGIEELRWGGFGSHIHLHPSDSGFLLDSLRQKSILYLTEKCSVKFDKRLELKQFLSDQSTHSNSLDALHYLGDWVNKNDSPYIHCAISNGIDCSPKVTLRPSPERMSKEIISEMYEVK